MKGHDRHLGGVLLDLMIDVSFRKLDENDASLMKGLRLSVLKSDPGSFSISIDEEAKVSTESLAEVLAAYRSSPDRIVYGAFNGELVGMIGIDRYQSEFTGHKARIWGLYVAKTHRGSGIGTALIEKSLQFTKGLTGIEKVVLEVTGDSVAAIRLYKNFGFSVFSTEENALKRGSRYVSEYRMELHLK